MRSGQALSWTPRVLGCEEHKVRQVSRIHLLVSDTAAANWVAKVVEALLPKLFRTGVEVRCHAITQLNAKEMRQGLVEFIRIAARIVKDAQSRGALAVVNATPGYKAETSLPVSYTHLALGEVGGLAEEPARLR